MVTAGSGTPRAAAEADGRVAYVDAGGLAEGGVAGGSVLNTGVSNSAWAPDVVRGDAEDEAGEGDCAPTLGSRESSRSSALAAAKHSGIGLTRRRMPRSPLISSPLKWCSFELANWSFSMNASDSVRTRSLSLLGRFSSPSSKRS